MKKLFFAFGAVLFISSSPIWANKVDLAVQINSCINTVNGHAKPLRDEPWHLTQAELELPYDHELTRLADGFFILTGRKLGHHGTWAAFLDVSDRVWVAYETKNLDDELRFFGESFVPNEVIEALQECDVRWGGYWTGEYPIVVLEPPSPTQQPDFFRLPADAQTNGAGLLPPIAE